MSHACQEVDAATIDPPSKWSMVRSYVVFHFLRHFPRWAPMLPQLTRPAVAPLRLMS
jgi:cardiolipin synthase